MPDSEQLLSSGSGEQQRNVVPARVGIAMHVSCPPSILVPGVAYLAGLVIGNDFSYRGIDWLAATLGALALCFLFASVPILDAFFDWSSDAKSTDRTRSYIKRVGGTRLELVILFFGTMMFGTGLALAGAPRLVLVAFPVYMLLSFLYSGGSWRLSDIGFVREGTLSILLVCFPFFLGAFDGRAATTRKVACLLAYWLLATAAVAVRDYVGMDQSKDHPRGIAGIFLRFSRGDKQKASLLLAVMVVGIYLGGAVLLVWNAVSLGKQAAVLTVAALSLGLAVLWVAAHLKKHWSRYFYRAGVSVSILLALAAALLAGSRW